MNFFGTLVSYSYASLKMHMTPDLFLTTFVGLVPRMARNGVYSEAVNVRHFKKFFINLKCLNIQQLFTDYGQSTRIRRGVRNEKGSGLNKEKLVMSYYTYFFKIYYYENYIELEVS